MLSCSFSASGASLTAFFTFPRRWTQGLSKQQGLNKLMRDLWNLWMFFQHFKHIRLCAWPTVHKGTESTEPLHVDIYEVLITSFTSSHAAWHMHFRGPWISHCAIKWCACLCCSSIARLWYKCAERKHMGFDGLL